MTAGLVRYRSPDEDSARWGGFELRQGDIVISARSKHGTTWTQMICALLVCQSAELPTPLATLSPWLDWLGEPLDDVVARLDAQRQRRLIKTHTPLDGIPMSAQATYIVTARHPLDAAVSLYHQGANLDRARVAELTGRPWHAPVGDRLSLHDWLVDWISRDASPREELDSLPGVMLHLGDAWARRHESNVVLLHYDDLTRDLRASMRALARRLEIEVPDRRWDELVEAATFEHMRSRADDLAPDPHGIFKDRRRFFRRGTSGQGRRSLSPDELARYDARATALAPPDLLGWLHRDSSDTSLNSHFGQHGLGACSR